MLEVRATAASEIGQSALLVKEEATWLERAWSEFADANIWQNRADIASYQSEGEKEQQMMRALELYGKAATHYAKAQAYALKARQN